MMPPRLLSALVAAALLCTSVAAQDSAIAFINVSVVPMDREVVLRDRTVVVRGDTIEAIGPAGEVALPAGATQIDGTGRYLMPGLAEMHAHLLGDNVELNERILLLNVSKGITTIRGMLGHPSHLALRERVRRGEVLGPTIYTSGPSFNGTTAPDEATARQRVKEQKAAGYDFLKIHPGVERGPFDALAATAAQLSIPFAGHVPVGVGLDRALEAGYATIDHLDGYVEALVKDGAPVDRSQPGFFGLAFIDHLDESKIPELVTRTKAAGVWNVPTQILMTSFMGPESTTALAARPEMRYLPKTMVDQWVKQRTEFLDGPGAQTPEKREYFFDVRNRIIKALDDADAGVLLGADSPQVMQVPGYAAHDELGALVNAGLSPYRALRAGTVNVARFFGTEDHTGTVGAGKEASLILLEANPLEDVGNAERIVGVMVRGKWLTQQELAGLLNKATP
jgi:imidazolonepropionase-like amidohydrolase